MVRIKGWTKDKNSYYDFWGNGRTSYVKVIDNKVEIVSGFQTIKDKRIIKSFNTKKEALKFAIKYMKAHPKG